MEKKRNKHKKLQRAADGGKHRHTNKLSNCPLRVLDYKLKIWRKLNIKHDLGERLLRTCILHIVRGLIKIWRQRANAFLLSSCLPLLY